MMLSPPGLRAALVTVINRVAFCPFRVPVITATPGVTAVTRPVELTVATAGVPLLQLTLLVTLMLLPSL
ncbi:hypothetical protein D3C76_1201610 [compost metagenome]